MADEPINELITIADGSNAEAKPLRQNFTYLQSLITQQQSGLENKLSTSAKGAANGVCPLNASSKINSDYIDFNGATRVIDSRINSKCVKLTDNQTVGGNKTFTGAMTTFDGAIRAKVNSNYVNPIYNISTSISDDSTKRPRGKVKLSNGMFFQWGKRECASSNTNYTVNFPGDFSEKTSYCFVMTSERSGMGTFTPILISTDKSSCVIRTDSNDTVYWFAIGY